MKKILILLSSLLLIFGLASCKGNAGDNNEDDGNNPSTSFSSSPVENYQTINVAYEVLGEVERKIPEVKNGGLSAYPIYGQNVSNLDKEAILAENRILNAGRTYDSMDADGNLYLKGEAVEQEFYKHTYADSNYYGGLTDEEPAVIKKITFNNIVNKDNNTYTTGLYAPAGEVVKIEIDAEDLAALGGSIEIYMGQVTNRARMHYLGTGSNFVRMPENTSVMKITSPTSYVGTYFGGPIYINKLKDIGHEFSITISGAVEYAHYILGSTTEADYERFKDSTAPFYELYIYDMLRFTGPGSYSFDSDGTRFDFAEITRSAKYWYNVAMTSKKVPGSSHGSWGIDTLFDCASNGGGLAYQGANFCINNVAWFANVLDYETLVNDGNWGNMHEINHHYQKFGVGYGSEVTNNAINLLEYAMYTNISANRNADTTLSGWNMYTDPVAGLKEVLNASKSGNPNYGLGLYSVLVHSLTPDQYISATSGNGVDNYFKSVSNSAKLDMTYYFTKILNLPVSAVALEEIQAKNYPMFVPAAISYQTGRGFVQEDGSVVYNHSAQPYKIAVENDFTIDFNKYLILPSGFTFNVESIDYVDSANKNPIKMTSPNVYVYTPNRNLPTSGAINVRISISNPNVNFTCEDIYLQLEFDHNNPALTITNYRYTEETMYDNVALAYANDFAGYKSVDVTTKENGVAGVGENTVSVFEGKIYVNSTGKYRIALKGNVKSMLFISFDGQNYSSAGYVNKTINSFDNNNPDTYTDYELEIGDYVYFKVVMAGYAPGGWTEVGMGKFNGEKVSIGSIDTKYLLNVDLDYNEEIFVQNIVYQPSKYASNTPIDRANASIVEATNADKNELKKLLDNDWNTRYTSDITMVTEETPVCFTIDLGATHLLQSFTLVYWLQWSNTWYCAFAPVNYKVYGGTDINNMQLIGDYKNQISDVNKETGKTVYIDPQPIRYIRFEITSTYKNWQGTERRFALKEIIFNSGYNMLSIDDRNVQYSDNDWDMKNDLISTYGHYFEGQDGTIKVDFEGTLFMINAFTSSKYGKLYVSIDGQAEVEINLNGDSLKLMQVFVSDTLERGKHTITIRGEGLVNIESFGYIK